ncbi:MAG: hypothetical protein ACI9UK_002355 [Candidatus Krumholzibacteriia bacterium]|jgi:hypothetical protein
MKNELESQEIQCPYCWESFELLIDCSVPQQSYVEDCEVCCRPILFQVSVGTDGTVTVGAAQEDD